MILPPSKRVAPVAASSRVLIVASIFAVGSRDSATTRNGGRHVGRELSVTLIYHGT